MICSNIVHLEKKSVHGFPQITISRRSQNTYWWALTKLEQLERLRSEDIPFRLMINHTIKSYWIPSQKKTTSKLQI